MCTQRKEGRRKWAILFSWWWNVQGRTITPFLEIRLVHPFVNLEQKNCIRHLHTTNNTPYLPHPPRPILHNRCFHFSWVLQSSQEKLKTVVMQNFGGQIRCMHYGKCGSPPLHISHTPCLPSKDFHNLTLNFPLVLQSSQKKLKTAYAKQGLL